MSVEVRRRAAENAFQKARDSGQPVEKDDRFHAWIEDWIAGDIEMSEVARHYRSLVRERASKRSVPAGPPMENTQDNRGIHQPENPFDLETEVDRLSAEDLESPKA
jgi:hypothetical protein